MYYYGYNGGYTSQPMYPNCYVNNSYGYTNVQEALDALGYTTAIILVLFILLVIIFGVGFWNNNQN